MTLLVAATLCLQQAPPTLKEVEAKIRTLPGIELHSEMVRPSVVPMHFKISPKGYYWAKYPSSEEFIGPTKRVTWIPDRREFTEEKPEPGNPLPVGYDCLWPGDATYQQSGETTFEKFHDWQCLKIICKGAQPHTIELFVEQGSLLPRGTRVELNGTTYEIVHKTISIRDLSTDWLQFRKPSDARPAGKYDPAANLIKPGTALPDFLVNDLLGRKFQLKESVGKSGAVINFWFSACTGCIAEMPHLVKLAPKLKEAGVTLMGVNTVDAPSIAKRTSQLHKLPFPTLVGKGANALTSKVGVGAYPVTLVVDSRRNVVDAILGFQEERLNQALKKIGVD